MVAAIPGRLIRRASQVAGSFGRPQPVASSGQTWSPKAYPPYSQGVSATVSGRTLSPHSASTTPRITIA